MKWRGEIMLNERENGRLIHEIICMQNYSRWDDFAPRLEDNTASHSFRVSVYALIAGLIEKEVFKKEVDLERLVCRAVFHDLKLHVTGPIRHETKEDSVVGPLIKKEEKRGTEQMIHKLSSSIQPVFYDYMIDVMDDSFEGRILEAIDAFDAMIFCHREMMFGSNYEFPGKFEETAEQLRNHELDSIKYMMKEFDEKKSFYLFLFGILMLDRVKRWSGRFSLVPDNDAIHSYRTTGIAIFNTIIEQKKHGVEVNLLKVAAGALLHDFVETKTGDILGPFKHSSPELKKAFAEYEHRMNENLIAFLPKELQPYFVDFMLYAKDDSYEGTMVEIADKMDALIKSNLERKINPYNYQNDYESQLKKIQTRFEQPCVVFFLAYILHDLNHARF